MKNYLLVKVATVFILFVCLISSCVSTKYTYNFDKGKSLDFSSGKWILNKPYANKNIEHLEDIAFNEFNTIIIDSLYKIEDIRNVSLIGLKLPYKLSADKLGDLKIGTYGDFIINYKVDIISDELNSLSSPPPIGTVRKINEVLVEILIYDIKNLELLSRSSILGRAKLDINEEDSGWNLADTPKVISRKALSKLIKQYQRNKIRSKQNKKNVPFKSY